MRQLWSVATGVKPPGLQYPKTRIGNIVIMSVLIQRTWKYKFLKVILTFNLYNHSKENKPSLQAVPTDKIQ